MKQIIIFLSKLIIKLYIIILLIFLVLIYFILIYLAPKYIKLLIELWWLIILILLWIDVKDDDLIIVASVQVKMFNFSIFNRGLVQYYKYILWIPWNILMIYDFLKVNNIKIEIS